MNNMTVHEFLNAFVPRWHAIRVMHFPETYEDKYAEVLYEGDANFDDMPDEVESRIVSCVIAIDDVLCISVI